MSDKRECRFFLAINENGDFEVDTDGDEITTRMMENNGGSMIRVVEITAHVAPPVMVEVLVDVPDEAGHAVEIEAETENASAG